MEEIRREKLIEAGVNVETAMERFMGNEELLVRFLKKFLQDNNYELLKDAMEEKRYKDAFTAAHTLKGLCGNLSLVSLFDIVDKELEFLRNDHYEEAEQVHPDLVKEYERIIPILEAL